MTSFGRLILHILPTSGLKQKLSSITRCKMSCGSYIKEQNQDNNCSFAGFSAIDQHQFPEFQLQQQWIRLVRLPEIRHHRKEISFCCSTVMYRDYRIDLTNRLCLDAWFIFQHITDELIRQKENHKAKAWIEELLYYAGSFSYKHTIAFFEDHKIHEACARSFFLHYIHYVVVITPEVYKFLFQWTSENRDQRLAAAELTIGWIAFYFWIEIVQGEGWTAKLANCPFPCIQLSGSLFFHSSLIVQIQLQRNSQVFSNFILLPPPCV